MHAKPAPVTALLSRSAAVIPSWPQQIITSGANSVDNTVPSTSPTLAGLFFCLASAEGAGLLFCSATIQPHTNVYSTFCACPCNLTANTARQRTRPCNGFSCDYTHLTANDTRPTQAAIIPPAPRWSVSQRPDALHRCQIPAPRRDAIQASQPPYYNNV